MTRGKHNDQQERYKCYETGNDVTSPTRKAGVRGVWNTALARAGPGQTKGV